VSTSSRLFVALGTSSQVPTRERNHNGYFLRWDACGLLFDPGEGTQRQMIYANVSASAITHILITHFHGDHCLGLAGTLQRLSLDRVTHTVRIFYPASGQVYFDNLRNASIYYDIARIEQHPISHAGMVHDAGDFVLEAQRLEHTVESWGYRLREKDSVTMLPRRLEALGITGPDVGRLKREGSLTRDGATIDLDAVSAIKRGQSIAFGMDTGMCEGAARLARDADLLVCESTYLESEAAEAAARGHLTATGAAQIARDNNAHLLALTHYSQRYQTTEEFAAEARRVHRHVVALRDGDSLEVPRRPSV
jgi:ribonuclease Z